MNMRTLTMSLSMSMTMMLRRWRRCSAITIAIAIAITSDWLLWLHGQRRRRRDVHHFRGTSSLRRVSL